MHMRRLALLLALATACGAPKPAAPPPASFPDALLAYMRSEGWGQMHLRWHTERRWDRLPPTAVAYAERQGWQRATHQEGDAGNGVEFLAMHRAMFEMLVEHDPTARSFFDGWKTPPTDPLDPANPLPRGATTAFEPDMLAALDRLEHRLSSFASEDELGLYIETSFNASDNTAGVHNYLHKRFQDSSSPIDLGNPSVNLQNPRFWRLHGWIDRTWARYRAQAGLRDTDPDHVAVMSAAHASMDRPRTKSLETPPAELLDAVRP